MGISTNIHEKWREIEDIATAATGPTLIVASIAAATDVFSNGALSLHAQWLPLAWAAARAAAVTMWLGISFDFYLQNKSGWWLIMSGALFGVDLQTALLFAIQDEHLRDVGTIPLVTIPAMYWVFEQAILGVVLIAVHRAVIHQTASATAPLPVAAVASIARAVTVPALIRPTTQPDDEAPGRVGAERVARRAYWDGPVSPLMSDEGVRMELVSDEQAPDERLTRQTRKPGKKGVQRRDAGQVSPEIQRRRRRLLAEMRRQIQAEHVMTIEDVMEYLNKSRGTAVNDRQQALQWLKEDYPEDWAAFQARYRQHGPHVGHAGDSDV
jgi:hypothetical protein